MGRVVTIHQPQYLPWIPYFDKILRSDAFIFLDDVQFQKNGMQNRNQIKTANGVIWLTVPVRHSLGQNINETEINGDGILEKHLKTIEQSYKKSRFYEEVISRFRPVFQKSWHYLGELNIALIQVILDYLGYEGEIVCSSQLGVDGKGSDLVLNICKKMKASKYLSGQGGKNYMRLEDFEREDIQVEFQKYSPVTYRQLFPEQCFMSHLSIIDLLFNMGPESRKIIEQGRDV